MNIFFPPHQEVVFLYFSVLGILLGAVYDVFVIKRKLLFDGFIWCLADDIIYVLICGFSFITTVFIVNNGIVRWYEFICCLAGFVLYKNTVSKIFLKIMGKIINLIHMALRFAVKRVFGVIKILFKPFASLYRFVLRLLTPITVLICKKIYINKILFSFKKCVVRGSEKR